MSLLSALRNQDEATYTRPSEEPLGDLVVDSVVLTKDVYRRELTEMLRHAFRKEHREIERERDEWKAKAMSVELDLAAIRRDIREILYQLTLPSVPRTPDTE